jgi:hypothetical protein
MGDDGWNGTIGSGTKCGHSIVIALAFLALPVFFGAGFALMHFL